MRFRQIDTVIGLLVSAAIGLVFVTAMRSGMSSTGLHGGMEVIASLLFLLTLPAGTVAAMCGRSAMPLGAEAAFIVTGVAWMVLSLLYGATLARAMRRCAAVHHCVCRIPRR
jgi:hypothetical protein